MKICCCCATHWPGSLGPHASCVHEVSQVHARCVRSQARAANGSPSYFHRRNKAHKESLTQGTRVNRNGCETWASLRSLRIPGLTTGTRTVWPTGIRVLKLSIPSITADVPLPSRVPVGY